jgi:hypothetical protein
MLGSNSDDVERYQELGNTTSASGGDVNSRFLTVRKGLGLIFDRFSTVVFLDDLDGF